MAGIPQVITEDRASGAQVVDGSLKIDSSKGQYLKRTFPSAGNQRTYTYSVWLKRGSNYSAYNAILTSLSADNNSNTGAWITNAAEWYYFFGGSNFYSNAIAKDTGWYHVVYRLDTTIASPDSDRLRVYVNGNLISWNTSTTGTYPALNATEQFNSAASHSIGRRDSSNTHHFDGSMSQFYFIDGQSLGPENFGYTDPLTDTWRPKKYTGDFNITSSDYTGVFAPYSAISRWNSFKTYTTVNENSTGHTLPMSNPSHYGGKTLDLASGGFQVKTNNSAAGDFFMAVWVNLDSYATGKQMGVDIAGNYVYFETQTNGAIKIRHTGSGGNTSSSGYANDTNQWQHWALSRSGGSLRAFVDGEEIVTDTGGISGNNTVLANSKFNFFGADNNPTSYNIDGQVIDAVIYIGQGVSGNFTPPTAPLIDASGNINHYSGFSDSQLYFASPLVDVSGSDPNSATDYISTGDNSFYLPMDGNTPIGKDQSGNGNDWTPVNFGGSVELSKATGAIPILNTNEAGTVAKRGVRTDSKTYTVTASGGNYYLDGALKPTPNVLRGGSYTFDYTGATSHPFYLSSLQDGKHNSNAYSVEFDGSTSSKYLSIDDTADLRLGTGDWTIEEFVYIPTGTPMPSYWVNSLSVGGESNTEAGASIYHTNANGGTDGGVSYIGPSNSYRLYHKVDTRGRWAHIAVTRESGTVRLFVDGTLADSTTDNTDYNATTGSKIGVGSLSQNNYLTGKVSNVRVVKGQALYTSNFTPPSTTLTTTSQGAIASNVKLLCCQDNDPTNATVIPTGSTISNTNSVAAVNSSPFLYDINGYYGVNTATSNTTKITIPHYAADTLYYYCSAHSGMGSSINVTTDVLKADPYAWKNVLAMPLVGSSVDYSGDINVGTTSKSVTNNSGPNYVTTSSNFYSKSGDFSGTTTQKKIDITTSGGDFGFGLGNFTIEWWMYATRNSTTNGYVWDTTGQRSSLIRKTNGGMTLETLGSGGAIGEVTILSGGSYGLHKWMHWAVVRDGDEVRVYLDGELKQTTTGFGSVNFGDVDGFISGYHSGGAAYNADAFLQDFRIYKGLEKYTSNFIPASTSPDILPDTPSGVSGKSKITKTTSGSVRLNSSADYLVIPSSPDFSYGISDFTIEAFVYLNQTPTGNIGIIDQRDGGEGTATKILLAVTTDNKVKTFVDGADQLTTPTVVRPGTWQHIVYTRSGTTGRIFVDGILQVSGTDSKNYSADARVALGHHPTVGSRNFPGYISNLRIVNGTALYTSDFTPPIEPLTAVTNTVLLCCQSKTSAMDVAAIPIGSTENALFNFDFTYTPFSDVSGNSIGITNSNSVASVTAPSNSFGITHAAEFTAGSSQKLDTASVNQNTSGAFSFDGFFYLKNVSETGYLFDGRSSTYTSSYYIYYTTDSASGTATFYTTVGSFVKPVGQWFHIRATSSGVWYNGEYQSAASGNLSYQFTTITIGSRYTSSTYMSGYVGAFRFFTNVDVGPSSASQYQLTYGVPSNTLETSIKTFGGAKATTFDPFTDDIDAIRGQETGYCTWSPLTNISGTLFDGNLLFYGAGSNTPRVNGTISRSSGKWYYEVTVLNDGPGTGSTDVHNSIGWGLDTISNIQTAPNTSAMNHSFYFMDSGYYKNFAGANTDTGTGKWLVGDVIGVAADLDNNNLEFFKNGVSVLSQGIRTPAGTSLCPAHQSNTGNYGRSVANFGQKPFKFPPPDGFQPLTSSTVIPDTVVSRPDQYVGVTTYRGNNTVGRIINIGRNADLVWIKKRNTAENNVLVDTVRGANNFLMSDSSNAANTSGGPITEIGETVNNGFIVDNNGYVNANNADYVCWNWKAGGSKNTFNVDDVGYATAAEAGLTAGTITPDAASVGTKQGFSIIKYSLSGSSAQTIPHGLDGSLGLLITKATTTTNGWAVWHSSINDNAGLVISGTNDASNVSWWDQSNMTNNVFAHTAGTTSQQGAPIIAYCWHDVPGLQKFGHYTGNSSSSGPFIECGFRPEMILLKKITNTDSNSGWHWYDNKRNTFNPANNFLLASANYYENRAQNNTADVSSYTVGFLSNGFRLTHSSNNLNSSGETYIYCAWAEAPTVNLYGAQANAR